MFVQIVEGWRFQAGERARVQARVAQLHKEVGPIPLLRPGVTPGLIAHLIATDPHDADAAVEVWIWESEKAANAYAERLSPEAKRRLVEQRDTSQTSIRNLDGLYFAHQ